MEHLILKSKQYKYNSMEYLSPEDMAEARAVSTGNDCVFAYAASTDKIHLHWAANTKDGFFNGMNTVLSHLKESGEIGKKLYLEFIPEEFLSEMETLGFEIVSEFKDFWKPELKPVPVKTNTLVRVRPLALDELAIAVEVADSCIGISRGFFSVSEQEAKELVQSENSCILAAEMDGKIVGVCHLNLYGFESEKGTILWLKVLAVHPSFQNKGIGRILIEHAINWGTDKGAKRSFLASDAENKNAIKLYEAYGYTMKSGRGQINMAKTLV